MEEKNTILIVAAPSQDVAGLELALAAHNYRIVALANADSACAAVAAGGVALVLLDARLAGGRELEQVGALAQSRPGARTPVLLMSSRPSHEEQQRAARAGADGYFALPLASCDVVDQVLQALRGPRLGGHEVEVNYHAMMSGSPDAVMLLDADSGLPIDVNARAEQMLGRSALQLLATPLQALCAPIQPGGQPLAETLRQMRQHVLAAEVRVYPLTFLHASGRQVDCEARVIRIDKPGHLLFHMRLVDVTGVQRAEALRKGQNDLLEMVARGQPLVATLCALVELIESQSDGVLCSVMLLDEDGVHMRCACGPGLPEGYRALLEGMAIGPGVGSCGTAMHRREAVVVSDIEHDPLWMPYLGLIRDFGLRACWSMPILQDENQVLGSFAMYYKTIRHPDAAEQRLIAVASHLASIAIERDRGEAELARHRTRMEELVQARTAELKRAKEHAELTSEELKAALEHLSLTQEELVRRDKLAALGALVSGVAHELNTPIGNSLMTASTLGDHAAALAASLEAGIRRSELDQYLAEARASADILQRNLQRAAGLVASFKQIAVDAHESQRRSFELQHYLDEFLAATRAGMPAPAPLFHLQVAPGLQMDSYPGPLGQALGHIIGNCVAHAFSGKPGEQVTVSAHAAGGDIVLSVADNGAGMTPEQLRRVFDPFYTTRMGAGQSGLGLYITHNIVTGVLGGHIDVDSRPGAGTTFTMRLPAVAPL